MKNKCVWVKACFFYLLVCIEEKGKFIGMILSDYECLGKTLPYETAIEVKEALIKEVRLIGEKIIEGADSLRKEFQEEQKDESL